MASPVSPDLPPHDAPASAGLDLETLAGQIDCELSFELARLSMTLAEISNLRPGQVLSMAARLQDEPVRLVTAGRAIGRGELAVLGDELVVVVTDTTAFPRG